MKCKVLGVVLLITLALQGVPFVQVVRAQSVEDLQARIAALLAQVQSLQAQLLHVQGEASCHTFPTNLRIGMSGSEVTALQTALQQDGESVNTTGMFDDQTASGVTGFQEKYASQILTPNGLRHGTGYVGASTRAQLNVIYGCNVQTPSPQVSINGLLPSSGSVGTSVTINGSGFTPTGNTIEISLGSDVNSASPGVVISNESSNDGRTLIFVFPSSVKSRCEAMLGCQSAMHQVVPGEIYAIRVIAGMNTAGINNVSNSVTFSVTQGVVDGTPSITSLSPVSGPVGTNVTINGSGFFINASQNTVNFAGALITPNSVATNGSSLSFTVPGVINPSCYRQCLAPSYQVTPGIYPISITNANGTSNSVNFMVPASVTCLACTLTPTISSLSPTSGSIGTQVTITGAGFAASENVINFGPGEGIPHINSSNNGTSLTFPIFSFFPPQCWTSSVPCPGGLIVPGSYSLSVTNVNGTSNSVNFMVTQ